MNSGGLLTVERDVGQGGIQHIIMCLRVALVLIGTHLIGLNRAYFQSVASTLTFVKGALLQMSASNVSVLSTLLMFVVRATLYICMTL